MTISNSPLASEAIFTYNLNSGNLFFFDTFLITEIFEGVIIGENELVQIIDLAHNYYGFDTPYGIISNRLNSYSVNLSELIPISHKFKNMVANAVIIYSELGLNNFELEKRTLNLKSQSFSHIEGALQWTKMEVEHALKIKNKT